ncbi:hypothetical protein Tco_1459261 [Tanacetum coccineum]
MPVFYYLSPIETGHGQHIVTDEYRIILKLTSHDSNYFPFIGYALYVARHVWIPFGNIAVHCKELPRFKYRHDMVRDVLFDICKRVGISAKKEAHVNFLTDPSDERSTLKPAKVLIFGWVEGKHAIIPGPTGIVQLAKLRKQSEIQEGGVDSVLSTQEYMKKVVEDVSDDEDFKSGSWVSATDYVNANGGIDKLTSGDKSLDLSAFKLSRLFFSLLSSGSSSCWRSYGAQ